MPPWACRGIGERRVLDRRAHLGIWQCDPMGHSWWHMANAAWLTKGRSFVGLPSRERPRNHVCVVSYESGRTDANYPDGVSSRGGDLWVLALYERLKVRQNCGIADAAKYTDDHRKMSTVLQRLLEQWLGSASGLGEQNARDRALILVVRREGVYERAAHSRLPGYAPQRARGEKPHCRPYVHGRILRNPRLKLLHKEPRA